MKNKKKLLVVLACLALCVCTVVTGTLAWLTAKTETVTNTFSPSNIQLTLTETGTTDNKKEFKMVPSQEFPKDPTVTVTADIASYVFVKVEKVNNPDTYLDYSIAGGWTELTTGSGIYYRAVPANPAEGFHVLTGDKVTVKSGVTMEQMNALYENGQVKTDAIPTLKFTAYAIQQLGFADAAAAWEVAKNLP